MKTSMEYLNYIATPLFHSGTAAEVAEMMENITAAAVPDTVDSTNALIAAAIAFAAGVLIYIYRRRRTR